MGYQVSESQDSWLINWRIQDKEIQPPDVGYIGRYELKRAERGKKIVSETGYKPWSYLGTANPKGVVIRKGPLKVLDNGVEKIAKNGTPTSFGKHFIFTRNRKHVFSWHSDPAIYSIPDLKEIKRLEKTETFIKFSNLFTQKRDKRSVLLTENLSYLIFVPQNGNGKGLSTRAYCYDIEQDKFSKINLAGLGEAKQSYIYDAEMIKGKMHWLVRQVPEGNWVILDSQSHVISEFTLLTSTTDYSYTPYWQPDLNLIWLIKLPGSYGSNYKIEPLNISVIKHNISDGTRVEIPLPAFDKSQLIFPE